MKYESMQLEVLQKEYAAEQKSLEMLVKDNLSLDMSRGKPSPEQIDLVMPLLDALNAETKFPKGADYRNYGILDGIPELKNLFGSLLGVPAANVFVGGNSSLNLMYDMIADSIITGVLGSTPWAKLQNKVKFICPVPGYDRHFNICEKLGIEMISVPMNDNGPDMDIVESLVKSDDSIKGIWCVPRFSNPSGIVYSDEVVKRLATMSVAAADFRIYYDNAYFIHELDDNAPKLANIFEYASQAGTEDRIYMFASTSKITFPGAGVSCICASKNNIEAIKEKMGWRTICFNKVWQYAHVLYLKDADNVKALLRKQRDLMKPKFDIVLGALKENFGDSDLVTWTEPKGGYFICIKCPNGTAKDIWQGCKAVGLTITPAGASHPLHRDDFDSFLRIAPTYPSIDKLTKATKVLMSVMKLVIMEHLLGKK